MQIILSALGPSILFLFLLIINCRIFCHINIMDKNLDLKIKIIHLEDELADCKAAVKDAFCNIEPSSWKDWWVSRYKKHMPNDPIKRRGGQP